MKSKFFFILIFCLISSLSAHQIDINKKAITVSNTTSIQKAYNIAKKLSKYDVYIYKTTTTKPLYYVIYVVNVLKRNRSYILQEIKNDYPSAYASSTKRIESLQKNNFNKNIFIKKNKNVSINKKENYKILQNSIKNKSSNITNKSKKIIDNKKIIKKKIIKIVNKNNIEQKKLIKKKKVLKTVNKKIIKQNKRIKIVKNKVTKKIIKSNTIKPLYKIPRFIKKSKVNKNYKKKILYLSMLYERYNLKENNINDTYSSVGLGFVLGKELYNYRYYLDLKVTDGLSLLLSSDFKYNLSNKSSVFFGFSLGYGIYGVSNTQDDLKGTIFGMQYGMSFRSFEIGIQNLFENIKANQYKIDRSNIFYLRYKF